MSTEQAVDTLLDKIEQTLLKVEDAQGKSVKLMKLETDLLGLIEKARDTMISSIQNTGDKDRKLLIAVFGGDCVRISRMRAYLEAAKLSEKNAADQRLPMCLSTCDIIERVLTEKGLGDKLRETNGRFIPWCPRPLGAGNDESAGYTPPEQPPKAPPPAPAPVPAPAPKPQPKPEPKPEPPSQASVQNVVTSTGTAFEEVSSDVPRVITITVSSELEPSFDFGPNGTMIMELEHITVKLSTTVEPPMPRHAKPFDAEQVFAITVPEVAKIVFDPAAGTPPEGKVEAIAKGDGKVLSIPEDIDVKVQKQMMSPYGYQSLLEGSNETQLQYEVQVDANLRPVAEDGGQALEVGLVVHFKAWLTGHRSAKFQDDGNPVDPPVR